MELADMSAAQLERIYARLYPGGFWDWRTLRITYPAKALTMRSVLRALRVRYVRDAERLRAHR